MTFVFPALLGGLVLAGVPILLHLILRQKPKTLPFPAFRFLVQKHRSNQRKLQLRHWLLLALRVLLLAGLILAVARPRLLHQNLGLSSERPVAAAFVFDLRPAMDYRATDNRSRLDDAKTRALELIDKLPGGSRIAILSDSGMRGDWTPNIGQARQRIKNLEIRPTASSLNAPIAAALQLLAEVATKRDDEPGTRLSRLLCVFSDTTKGSLNPAQTPTLIEASDKVPSPREMLAESPRAMRRVLAQLKELRASVPALSADAHDARLKETLTELVGLVPRLTASDFPLGGPSAQLVQSARSASRDLLRLLPTDEKEAFAIQLATDLRVLLGFLSGYQTLWVDVGMAPRDAAILDLEWPTPRAGSQFTLRPGGSLRLGAIVQALGQDFQTSLIATHAKGTLSQAFLLKADDPTVRAFDFDTTELKLGLGFHQVEFKLSVVDPLAVNNARFATFAAQPPRKILVLTDPTGSSPDYFTRSLESNQGVFNIAFDAKPHADIAQIPAGYDAVVLFGISAPGDGLWKALDLFARQGGGVAIYPGREAMKPEAYVTDAAKRVMPGSWKAIVDLGAKEEAAWNWQDTVYRHPLFEKFRDWNKNENINFVQNAPRVRKFWEATPNAGALVLVEYREKAQRPAVLERTLGTGKVLMFTTAFDLEAKKSAVKWNNYLETIHSFYLVITGLTAGYLTGESAPVQCNFLLGEEEPSVAVRDLNGRTEVLLEGPGVMEKVVVPPGVARLGLARAERPGQFVVKDPGDKNVLAAFSVNLPRRQVDLTRLAKTEIENLFGGESLIPGDRRADVKELLKGHWSEPIELFPYFMIALLLLLAVENLLANRFYASRGPV